MAAFFYIMQMYVYQMMVGFELKLKDIYKNAFLFSVIALPKNMLAVFVIESII